MARLPAFGKSKKDRLRGGETFTVIKVAPGKEAALEIKKDDRMRLETRPKTSNKANLYPEGNTQWFALGNETIKLDQLRDHPQKGKLYEFDVDLTTGKRTLWLEEGGAGGAELTLLETNPDAERTGGGAGSGAAGYRR